VKLSDLLKEEFESDKAIRIFDDEFQIEHSNIPISKKDEVFKTWFGELPFDYSDKTLNNSFYSYAYKKLTTLKGCPKIVNGIFEVVSNILTSLEGCPEQVFVIQVPEIDTLTSLKGSPKRVVEGGIWSATAFFNDCDGITEVKGIGREFLNQIDNMLILPNTIKSNILGVMLIKNLQSFMFSNSSNETSDVSNILNDHLKGERDILDCQEDLITHKYKEFAKL